MQISLIAAMDKKHVMGYQNKLPWHMPADLLHFKNLTLEKPIVMGRKTFESIGKPLPKRQNIILTRNPQFQAPGCTIVSSLDAALTAANPAKELMIIGGSELFSLALPLSTVMYLTLIHHEFTGDTYFPQWNIKEWIVTSSEYHRADEKNPYDYEFLTLERTAKR
jgi:dihydrofolate reductase